MGKAALRFSRKCGVILVSVAEFMFEPMLYGPSLVPDVVIVGWSRPWNLRGDHAMGGAPPAALGATAARAAQARACPGRGTGHVALVKNDLRLAWDA